MFDAGEKVVLLLCGSFNPPTVAHLRMLEAAKDHLQTVKQCQVLGGILSPVADAYRKPTLAKSNHRVKMSEAAVADSDWLHVSSWESSLSHWNRTFVVLTELQRTIQNSYDLQTRLALVVGSDVVTSFTALMPDGTLIWSKEDLLEIVFKFGLIVIKRDDSDPLEALAKVDGFEGCRDVVQVIRDTVFENKISSTRIRASIAANKSVKYSTTDAVISYIKEHQLYQIPDDQIKVQITNGTVPIGLGVALSEKK